MVSLFTLLQQAAGPVAVDALLTRVFSLAMHPDKNRRLGGLMAFNQLCRPLREETALLDRWVASRYRSFSFFLILLFPPVIFGLISLTGLISNMYIYFKFFLCMRLYDVLQLCCVYRTALCFRFFNVSVHFLRHSSPF